MGDEVCKRLGDEVSKRLGDDVSKLLGDSEDRQQLGDKVRIIRKCTLHTSDSGNTSL